MSRCISYAEGYGDGIARNKGPTSVFDGSFFWITDGMAVFFDSARVQTDSSLTNILSGWTRNDSLERSWPGGSRFAARFEGKPAPQSNIRRSEASLTERGRIMALGFRCGRGLVGGKWEMSPRGRLWGGHHLKSPASLSLSSAHKSESESLFLSSCLLRMLKKR